MLKIQFRLFAALLAVTLAGGFGSTIAQAQPARTFVSALGTDANPCSIAVPCRTLQRGINVVADGGDVLILDAGGFGSNVSITKSVSVIAPPGGQSRVVVPSGGFGVSTTGSRTGVAVALTGLGVSGADGIGVYFDGGASLSLIGVDIAVGGNGGVAIIHGTAGGHLTMDSSVMRNTIYCMSVGGTSSGAPPARATITRSRMENCGRGVVGVGYSIVAIKNSSASGDIATCDYNFGTFAPTTRMTLDNVVSSHCNYGVYISNGPTGQMTVSNSLFTGNNTAGLISISGTGRTYGNNRIFGNGVDALTGFSAIAEQ